MKKNKQTEKNLSQEIIQSILPMSKAFVVFGYPNNENGEKFFLAAHDTEAEHNALNEFGGAIGQWLEMGNLVKQSEEENPSSNKVNGRIKI